MTCSVCCIIALLHKKREEFHGEQGTKEQSSQTMLQKYNIFLQNANFTILNQNAK
jgi:hypothetical protein